jgi:hypothetical protein
MMFSFPVDQTHVCLILASSTACLGLAGLVWAFVFSSEVRVGRRLVWYLAGKVELVLSFVLAGISER